jgi:hypothetical protein
VDISTGTAESHPTPLPVDASALPGVVPVTPRTPDTGGGSVTAAGRDTTGEWQSQRQAGEADVRAAQAAGTGAETGRRGHYGAQVGSHGSAHGDAMDLPGVPASAVPAEGSYGYPYSGDEPTPAGAGFEYSGGEPG